MSYALLGEQDLPTPATRGYDPLRPEDHHEQEQGSEVDELVLELVVLKRADLEVLGQPLDCSCAEYRTRDRTHASQDHEDQDQDRRLHARIALQDRPTRECSRKLNATVKTTATPRIR